MNTSKAGIRKKIEPLSSNLIIGGLNSKNEKAKCPTPRSSVFSIDSVLAPFSTKNSEKPFKFISFDSSTTSPKHRRQPSVIINNVSQVYNFAMEINSPDEVSDEEVISKITHHQKNSIFASTTDPKSSVYNSMIKKSCSDEEINKNEYSEYAELSEGITKPDENYTNLASVTQEDGHSTPLGILPKRLYCQKCKMDTTTIVTMKMPTLPFWKTMCCIGDIEEICGDFDPTDRYQEFQHICKNCKRIIASAQPF